MKRLYADLGLLVVALIWGSTFPVVKLALDHVSPFAFNALRFLLTSLLFLPFLKRMDFKAGFIIGFTTFLGYAFQTVGLQFTTATNAGFITSIYIVLTPVVAFLLYREKIAPMEILATILAFLGLYLLSGYSGFRYGDILILFCAVSFAFEIVLISHYSRNSNPISLAGWQVLAVGIFSSFFVPFTTKRFEINSYVLIALLITGIFATLVAKILQNYLQAYTKSVDAGIILSMEGVFSHLFSLVFLNERLSLLQYSGVALTILALILVSARNER